MNIRMKDEYSDEEYVRDERDKGRQEGKTKGKIEDAKAFKQLGVSIETIVTATGLTKEPVEQL